MPRPKKVGGPEPKKRSRTGCWPCKARKVKCDELRPICVNCQRQGETCDYNIRLQWDGRPKKKGVPSESIPGSCQTISLGPSKPSASGGPTPSNSVQKPASAPPPTSSSSSTQTPPPFLQREGIEEDKQHDLQEQRHQNASTSRPGSSRAPPIPPYHGHEAMTIDPALVGHVPVAPMFFDSYSFDLHVRPDAQYAPSYERCRPRTSSAFAPHSATPPHFESPTSAPPFFGNLEESIVSAPEASHGHPSKRRRFRYEQDLVAWYPSGGMPPPHFTSYNSESTLPNNQSQPLSLAGTPLTPDSAYGGDGPHSAKRLPLPVQDHPDLRRLSVKSLLSGPPGIPSPNDHVRPPRSNPEAQDWSIQAQDLYQDTRICGIDHGFKDLDIPRNDDENAISGSPPVTSRDHMELVLDEGVGASPVEFGFGMETNSTAFEAAGYYDKPVIVSIPRILGPLPTKLLENKMNLLYFHHFINHTAGCLIPHNCSSNPFKSILPQMAVQDDNLLNLLLAYSASHRARLLRQPEPANRIAFWVQDIFPNLRRALDDPSARISDANLATAIMLASLEIISPKAFGVAVPWQQHLSTARQMMAARGGPQKMQTISRKDKVASFLWSWFAYLDVLGSLSGGKANAASSSWILDYDIDAGDDYQIDCILGFTSKCICLLAKIAELARICDHERIGPDFEIYSDWKPSQENISRAEKLEADLAESRQHPAKACTHMQSRDEVAFNWDTLEMAATNEAFHWAGLVHLHRRIWGKPSTHPDVQNAVRQIFGALYKVRRGSSAEACLLFPMFTAGCDTQDQRQRDDILERIKGVERFGMTQVHKARTLMERVWETGKPWETLVAGEFFG